MALRNAVNASLQRVSVYSPSATAAQKKAYREALKTWLKQFALRYYAWEYDGARYCREIEALKLHLLSCHSEALAKVTIGTCQKAMTVWLKYLWLSGDPSKKPVFAALDRGIMSAALVPCPPNWPDIDTVGEYRRIVDHIDQYARKKGLGSGAVWEAETWSDEGEDESS